MSPASEWAAVQSENPPWWRALAGYLLPLAFLPALGWATGQLLAGTLPMRGGGLLLAFAASVTATVLLSLLGVALLALAFYLLAPTYDTRRHWDRAFSIAAYGSTPVLLAGVLLVVPMMVMASMVALLHNFLLYYVGLARVAGCKQRDAAEYLALSCMCATLASGTFGALGAAFGLG